MTVLARIAVSLSAAAGTDGLVGDRIPPHPIGLEDSGGACIGSTAIGAERACDYSVGIPGGAGATCTDNGKSDDTILAAVQVTDTEWLEQLVWARRYDLETGRFVLHPTANVRCYNDSWGL